MEGLFFGILRYFVHNSHSTGASNDVSTKLT